MDTRETTPQQAPRQAEAGLHPIFQQALAPFMPRISANAQAEALIAEYRNAAIDDCFSPSRDSRHRLSMASKALLDALTKETH